MIRKKPLARSAHPKKRARPAKKTLRIYGSPARRKFVKSLPCYTCHVEGYTEQAHCAPSSEKGTGYKAGYLWIVPLCGRRGGWWPERGCHILFDRFRDEFNMRFPDFDPEKAASETQSAWLLAQGEEK